MALDDPDYRLAKHRWWDRIVESAVRFVPDFRARVIDTDMFTPGTIVRYTGHDNGAVYGAPDKQLDGTTHLDNLFVCGTDQGFVGCGESSGPLRPVGNCSPRPVIVGESSPVPVTGAPHAGQWPLRAGSVLPHLEQAMRTDE